MPKLEYFETRDYICYKIYCYKENKKKNKTITKIEQNPLKMVNTKLFESEEIFQKIWGGWEKDFFLSFLIVLSLKQETWILSSSYLSH